jgi:hypothetical protein
LRAAPATTTAAAAENILEAKKIAEDILKLIEDRLIDAAIEAAARKSRVAEAVERGTLLRIGKNRVSFGGFPELFLRFLFTMRIAIRMPLQRRFAIGGFDFFRGGGALN